MAEARVPARSLQPLGEMPVNNGADPAAPSATAKGQIQSNEDSVADAPSYAAESRRTGQESGRGAAEETGHGDSPPIEGFRFHVDEISAERVSGWIMDPERPTYRPRVGLRKDGQIMARAIASGFRADLADAGIGDGTYAFELSVPAALLNGESHSIQLVEQNTGFLLTPDPVILRCDLPAPQQRSGVLGSVAARLFDLRSEARSENDSRLMRVSTGVDFSTIGSLAGDTSHRRGANVGTGVQTRILFDICDLIYYIGEHANLTGIQRVQSSIILAILRDELFPPAGLIFLSFNTKTRKWVRIPTSFLHILLEDLFLPESQRLVGFPAEQARYGVLPGATEFTGAGVLDDGSSSVLCLLGAAWVNQDYLHHVLALKRQYGTKFAMAVHDLIPIYATETCDQDTARVFEEFMRRALRHADHLLSVSENTAADIKRYTASLMIPTPPITVTRNGSSFAEFLPQDRGEGDLPNEEIPERFVLFVATIEGRKNHDLILRIWNRMIAEGDDPPHLVCVGRLGWKSSAFITALIESDYLDGCIHLLRDVSDTDLQTLYERCLFTLCPSLYEGWGLPVGEALAMGKICVTSTRASLPEVAGEFGIYINIDDFEGALAIVRDLIADGAKRKQLETKIRRGYKPVSWRAVAEKVVGACCEAVKVKWEEPYPYTVVPYSTEISFAKLDRSVDGTGDFLLRRIATARRGLFLPDALDDRAFQRGEEVRAAGWWAYPEDWGTWACRAGGEIVLMLPQSESTSYYVFLRVRASGMVIEKPISISANGEPMWEGAIGPHPRDVVLRVRRRRVGTGLWRLSVRAQIALTPELEARIAAEDSRIPTIGFERMIVVPDNDIKARLDVLYSLLL